MVKRVVIVHGWGGFPEEGWRPWLKKELSARGYVVSMPAMPVGEPPCASAWVDAISKVVGTPNESTFLVGHSLGAMAIVRYLEQLEYNWIGGAVFVAGFIKDLGMPHGDFFTTPVNYPVVREHCKNFTDIYSDNDPYVPMVQAQLIRKELGAKTILAKGMKHFSADEGCEKAPVILNEILSMSGLV